MANNFSKINEAVFWRMSVTNREVFSFQQFFRLSDFAEICYVFNLGVFIISTFQ